jgi:ABC-type multidrug transport system permease subunit
VLEEAPLVLYRLLADLVVIVHLLFIAFVAVGGLLAVRWPRLVLVHVPVVLWAAAIVMIGFTCPLTPLEKALRERSGATSYDDGFVDHYLDGVVYPGRFTALARLLVAVMIVVSYTVLVARRRHRHTPASEVRPASARAAGS